MESLGLLLNCPKLSLTSRQVFKPFQGQLRKTVTPSQKDFESDLTVITHAVEEVLDGQMEVQGVGSNDTSQLA